MASGTLTLLTQSVDYDGGRGGQTMRNYIDWSTNGTTLSLSNGGRDGGNYWTLYNATGASDYLVVLKVQVNYGGGWQTISEQSAYIGTVAQGGLAIGPKSDEFINNLGSYNLSGPCSMRALYYATYEPAPTYDYPHAFPNESYSAASQTDVPVSVVTAPSGGTITNIVRGTDYITLTGGVSSMGIGGSQTYTELLIASSNYTQGGIPQRYEGFNSLTSTKTISNSSAPANGGITISPNTGYYIGVYANNGALDYRYDAGAVTTLAEAATVSVAHETTRSISVNWSTNADGGAYDKVIEYSLDGGQTWQTGATVTGGSAQSGAFSITGLTPDTDYTIQTRVTTTAGSTTGATLNGSTMSGALSATPTSDSATITYRHVGGTIPDSGSGVIELWDAAGHATANPVSYNAGDSSFSTSYGNLQSNASYQATLWDLNLSANPVDFATLPAAATVSNDTPNPTSVTINWSTPADGGAHAKQIQYSLDGGQTWVTGATVPAGEGLAAEGTYVISGLTPDTTYDIQTRVTTPAGSTNGQTLTVQTAAPIPTTTSISVTPEDDSATFSGTITPGTNDSGTAYITVDGTDYPLTYDETQEGVAQEVSVDVTGLTPNTEYTYTITTDSGTITGTFTTGPSKPDFTIDPNDVGQNSFDLSGTYDFGGGAESYTPRVTVKDENGDTVHTQTYPAQSSGTLTDPTVNYGLSDTEPSTVVVDILDGQGNVVETQTITYYPVTKIDLALVDKTADSANITATINPATGTSSLTGDFTLYHNGQEMDSIAITPIQGDSTVTRDSNPQYLGPNTEYREELTLSDGASAYVDFVTNPAALSTTTVEKSNSQIVISGYDFGDGGGDTYTVQYSYKEYMGETYSTPVAIETKSSGTLTTTTIPGISTATTSYTVKLDLVDSNGNIVDTYEVNIFQDDATAPTFDKTHALVDDGVNPYVDIGIENFVAGVPEYTTFTTSVSQTGEPIQRGTSSADSTVTQKTIMHVDLNTNSTVIFAIKYSNGATTNTKLPTQFMTKPGAPSLSVAGTTPMSATLTTTFDNGGAASAVTYTLYLYEGNVQYEDISGLTPVATQTVKACTTDSGDRGTWELNNSFSNLTTDATYTAFVIENVGSSYARATFVARSIDIRLYGSKSTNNMARRILHAYVSLNGVTELLEKAYGSKNTNNLAKLIHDPYN